MPGPAGQPGLSRDQIVGVALEIVEAEGLDGLTMRRLAGKLGVAATAIYWHVGDKEALLDALAERIAARVGDIPVAGDSPVERLVSIGAGLRRNLLEQPTLVGLVHQQGHTALLFQAVRRALVRELTAAGLRGPATTGGTARHLAAPVPNGAERPSPRWGRSQPAGPNCRRGSASTWLMLLAMFLGSFLYSSWDFLPPRAMFCSMSPTFARIAPLARSIAPLSSVLRLPVAAPTASFARPLRFSALPLI